MGFKARRRRVTVFWIDASVDNCWKAMDAPHGHTGECVTCGFLHRKDKDAIEIAQSYTKGLVTDIMRIPTGCVQRIEYH